MADPNDEVLRGGFFEANGYHQAFLDGQYHFDFFCKNQSKNEFTP